MQGLQNDKCIPLGHTSRFHPFIMVQKYVTKRVFGAHGTLYVSVKDEQFFYFYIIIKTILLRKCFEYVHPITRD